MADDLQVSDLRRAEIDQAIALWQAANLTRPWNDPRADAELALSTPSSTILAGRIGEVVVATVMVGFDGHRGAVYYLGVDPARRRKGYGAAMMRAAEAWLSARGAPKLNLMVRADNTQVRTFYERLGYEFEDRLNLARRLGPAGSLASNK